MWKKLLVLIVGLSACTPQQQLVDRSNNLDQKRPKNIILMIGDGMGLSQVSAGIYSSKRGLNIERFNSIGLQKTHCKDKLITDSAASGVAIARGIKADYSTFGSTEEIRAPNSILEELAAAGWATGLTVTSSLTHATPASFYSYQVSRAMYEEIAIDLVKAGVDFLVGGGLKYFERRDTDKRNLVEEMKNSGYQVSSFLDAPLEEIIIARDQSLYISRPMKSRCHTVREEIIWLKPVKGEYNS